MNILQTIQNLRRIAHIGLAPLQEVNDALTTAANELEQALKTIQELEELSATLEEELEGALNPPSSVRNESIHDEFVVVEDDDPE